MRMPKPTPVLLVCAGLAACAPVAPTPDAAPFVPRPAEVADPADPCGAGGYLGLIGREVAAVRLPDRLRHRVLGPEVTPGAGTDPGRLTLGVDAEGRIVTLFCG